jgi:cation diffusion facilitator family transporter
MKQRMADSSMKVVYAALLGNVLVALAKFAAAGLSGSGAMLTEAIHSSADSVNQLLLLIGNKRSRAPADTSHAFGYGLEIYFWTFVVAVMVLIAGGAASIVEGLHKLGAAGPIKAPIANLAVLAVAAIFEAASFMVGYRAYRRSVRGRRVDGREVGLWRFIQLSKDPNLYESLLEDLAALIGLGIAALGVAAGGLFGLRWADGAASIAIGILLILNSMVIARATQSLIAGEAAVTRIVEEIAAALRRLGRPVDAADIRTLHLGPHEILVALPVPKTTSESAHETGVEARKVAVAVRAIDERICDVLFDFDEPPEIVVASRS